MWKQRWWAYREEGWTYHEAAAELQAIEKILERKRREVQELEALVRHLEAEKRELLDAMDDRGW